MSAVKNWEVVHWASGIVCVQFLTRREAERIARAMPGCRARIIHQLRKVG